MCYTESKKDETKGDTMNMKRFTIEDLSSIIEAVMVFEKMDDKMKHDVVRAVENAWVGRGKFQNN